MGSTGPKRRKPKQHLPKVPRTVKPSPGGGPRWTWRLGGPITTRREAQAKAAQRSKKTNPLSRAILRILGYRPRIK